MQQVSNYHLQSSSMFYRDRELFPISPRMPWKWTPLCHLDLWMGCVELMKWLQSSTGAVSSPHTLLLLAHADRGHLFHHRNYWWARMIKSSIHHEEPLRDWSRQSRLQGIVQSGSKCPKWGDFYHFLWETASQSNKAPQCLAYKSLSLYRSVSYACVVHFIRWLTLMNALRDYGPISGQF